MTRDPARQAVLADRRRVRYAVSFAITSIRFDRSGSRALAGRVSPEERGIRLAMNEIEAEWREADRKARRTETNRLLGHGKCYPANICAVSDGGWGCTLRSGHEGKHHACLGNVTKHEWADRKARKRSKR